MGKSDIQLLKKLLDAFGVSGNEEEIRDLIKEEIKDHVDQIYVDGMGNLVAIRKGKNPKIMLTAHMDEVGLMIKRINPLGLIHCTSIGDIDTSTIIGQTVTIKTKKEDLHGVITTKEISGGKLLSKIPGIEEVIIDTGLNKEELIELGVNVGDYLRLNHKAHCNEKSKHVFGKALDNRLGCYVLIELIKKIKNQKIKGNPEIYYVFTVQEEIGLRGARPSAFSINPDWGLVVDTTYANDSFHEPSRYIGDGPCITVKDGEFIGNKCINKWLKDIADKKNIPVQLEAIEIGTTDASTIQTTAGGIPTSAICIPIRNIHTTIGVASIKDLKSTINLLEELLKNPPSVCLV